MRFIKTNLNEKLNVAAVKLYHVSTRIGGTKVRNRAQDHDNGGGNDIPSWAWGRRRISYSRTAFIV